ncbi:major antigen [Coffea eugenioides]|uniref:Uncharacterized protein n=1 Tax=Coffea arabica TaxID=13443 RepID=A0A6P6W2B8_COFAR|nr:major antigen-like [Coffea arabica]XP_027159361.1 major antigen [Coffea eugenioides]
MAKKKLTHNSEKETQKTHHEESAAFANIAAMDDASEKLESLKSLNARLLKETVERRREVEALVQSKGSLESELTRSNSEKERLRSELTRLSEGVVELDVERSVVFAFVAQQAEEVIERERDEIERKMKGFEREMGEILREKSEIEKVTGEKEREIELLNEKINELVVKIDNERSFSNGVCVERDAMRAILDAQIKEGSELGGKLIEAEKREKLVQEEAEKLRGEYDKLVRAKREKEKQIEGVMRDKELVEKSLIEVNKAIEKMKKEIEGVVKEKEGIEEERKVEMRKRSELQEVVNGLNETVGTMQKEEERLRVCVAELEKRCIEGEDKEREMESEIDELVKEKSEREKRLLGLIEENGVVEKDLDDALKQLDELKQKMEQIVNENREIAGAKIRKEKEILELEKHVTELRDAVSGMEGSCRVQKEKIYSLESEVGNYKDSLKRVLVERDEARMELLDERENGISLKQKIVAMEKNVEETVELVEILKAENGYVKAEKENLESCCIRLKKDIASAENELTVARKELDATKAELEVADAKSEQVLKVLRRTVELVCPNGEMNITGDKEMNGEIEPYVAELVAIKHAFKSREDKVEDMKRQVEILENSVAEAHKKKSFWTIMSSATTVFAAILLAYVTRGH